MYELTAIRSSHLENQMETPERNKEQKYIVSPQMNS